MQTWLGNMARNPESDGILFPTSSLQFHQRRGPPATVPSLEKGKSRIQSLPLHFSGPLTFTPGARSLFHSALQDVACVYLWTIRSEFDRNCILSQFAGASFVVRKAFLAGPILS
jgi:hypothetical protein